MPFHTSTWDLKLLLLINQHGRHALLDWIMPLFSSSILLWGLGAIAAISVLIRRNKDQPLQILCLILAVSLADAGSNVLKDTFNRVRPHKAVAGTYSLAKKGWKQTPELTQEKKKTSGSSYPSAHAANTMALAALAMLFWLRTRPWVLLLPIVVGYSRVYLGKHYPLDIVAGWLWGASSALILYLTWMLWEEWFLRQDHRPKPTST